MQGEAIYHTEKGHSMENMSMGAAYGSCGGANGLDRRNNLLLHIGTRYPRTSGSLTCDVLCDACGLKVQGFNLQLAAPRAGNQGSSFS